jgi:hypothetical protein
MAETPIPNQDSGATPGVELQQEAKDRLAAARVWKSQWAIDFREAYFFSAPQRQRFVNATTPSAERMMDEAELQTSMAFELCQDFVTEVVNTYMPEAQQWCERGPGQFIPPDIYKQVQDDVRAGDKQIFAAMKASNLYSEIQKSFYPDLAIGTIALWLDRPHAHQAVTVSAIPLRELEVNLGPYGEIDDRFAVRFTRNCHVAALLPGVTMPEDVARLIKEKPTAKTEIRWGFWRLWDKTDDEYWQHVVMVGDKMVDHKIIKGEGCCPLLVGRFNPSADWPWGLGPLLQALPDFRQIDELEARKIEAVSRAINPPITYPDDSFVNVEQGIEDGMAYPIRPGSHDAVRPIYTVPNIDSAVYQHDEMEKRLKRLFFVDFPEQTGDTPPTLGQWLDQMARAQRRIGTPGLPFWREVPAKLFLRFKYLLEAAGTIMPIKVDGKNVALQPYNPAQRAAEQQEIATAGQFLQIAGTTWPEEFRLQVDGGQTMKNLAAVMRVAGDDGIVAFRQEDQVAVALSQIKQLVMAKQPAGGEAPAEAGAPAAI